MTYSILHVADPHFSYCHFSKGTPAEIGVASAREIIGLCMHERRDLREFDCIVLSGDFSFSRNEEGFQAAVAFVAELSKFTRPRSVLVVPGNHDIQLVEPVWIQNLYLSGSTEEAEAPFRKFIAQISQYTPQENGWMTGSYRVQQTGLPALYIEGLNSCRVERRDAQGWGYIGVDQLYQLGKNLISRPEGERPKRGDIVIAVTHHHPLPIWDLEPKIIRTPPGERKISFMMDAAGLLGFLSDCGVMALLHGHTHKRSIKLVEGYHSEGSFTQVWVLGGGSFAIQRGFRDPLHHFQILDIDKGSDGYLHLGFTDFEADSCKRDSERQWRKLHAQHPQQSTVALWKTWDPVSASQALERRVHAGYRTGLDMWVMESWSVLRCKQLEPEKWPDVLSGICYRTNLGAAARGASYIPEPEIHKIVNGLFRDPPTEYEISNYRLEQIILMRWNG